MLDELTILEFCIPEVFLNADSTSHRSDGRAAKGKK